MFTESQVQAEEDQVEETIQSSNYSDQVRLNNLCLQLISKF